MGKDKHTDHMDPAAESTPPVTLRLLRVPWRADAMRAVAAGRGEPVETDAAFGCVDWYQYPTEKKNAATAPVAASDSKSKHA